MGGDHMPCLVGMKRRHLTAIILETQPKTNQRRIVYFNNWQLGGVKHMKTAVVGPDTEHCVSSSHESELHVLYWERWRPLFL